MKQDVFVDIEQGYSDHGLHVLNKAVDAFAEFDPLVARVLHLAKQGNWPREFALATLAYHLLHRHKDQYHGTEADAHAPVPPVRITVDLQPDTRQALKALLTLVQSHPPFQSGDGGQEFICAVCRERVALGHKNECGYQQSVVEAERLLKIA